MEASFFIVDDGLLYVSDGKNLWRIFSHKDPAVIWPIAERFDCFPGRAVDGVWLAALPNTDYVTHTNPCTAVALAVIAALGGGK